MTTIAAAPRARLAQSTTVILLTMSLGVLIARMIGATLGVAALGAIYASYAGGSGGAAGLPAPFIVGGIGEMVGTAAAFAFIRPDSLRPAANRRDWRRSTP